MVMTLNVHCLELRVLVASLPEGFCLAATMVTNYQQLKTMYIQRHNHKLKEWHVFCDWCVSLPHFLELTGADEPKSDEPKDENK
jgi:hypothetical protein